MIVLHHLNQSRSIRILWLLEEIGAPYRLVPYVRQKSRFAPDELKAVHPLGKAPILEIDGKVVAESGAMAELLISRYAPHLAPAADSSDYMDYLQWMHFAESSLMVPLLLEIFITLEPQPVDFLPKYAAAEKQKVLGYLNDSLAGKDYLVGGRLSGADFMVAFALDMLATNGGLNDYPHLQRYLETLAALPSWQRAQALERKHSV